MIHFVEVDGGNWRLDLKVSENQKSFVADRTTTLARAYACRNSRSQVYFVYDEQTPVGMVMYHDCEPMDAYDFSQLFIDHRYQGRGYGKAATRKVLEMMKKDGKYHKVVLCYIEGNEAAKTLYEGFGFRVIDRDDDEIIMEMSL